MKQLSKSIASDQINYFESRIIHFQVVSGAKLNAHPISRAGIE